MIASRLDVPVVPVRIDGLDTVLHHTWRMARPGPRRGSPSARRCTLTGDDYEALAKQVEDAVRGSVTQPLVDRSRPIAPRCCAHCAMWHNIC